MTIISNISLVFFVVAISVVGLGSFHLKRIGPQGITALAIVIGIGLFKIYLFSFCIYLLQLPNWLNFFVFALGFIGGIKAKAELKAIFRDAFVKSACIGYLSLAFISFSISLFIKNYSGGSWSLDWYEHYQRSLFFLNHWPLDSKLIGQYVIVARPPLFNAIAAHFMAVCGSEYYHFQIISITLNCLQIFSAFIALAYLKNNLQGMKHSTLLIILICCSPMILQNITFTWTRALTNFYIVLALAGLVKYLRTKSRFSATLMMISASVGTLSHYSGAPYLFVFGLIILIDTIRKRSIGTLAFLRIVVECLMVFSLWLIWAELNFVDGVFGATTTATESVRLTLPQNLLKIIWNTALTILPIPPNISFLSEGPWLLRVRELGFLFFQLNLFFMLGTGNLFVIFYHLGSLDLSNKNLNKEGQIWIWIIFTIIFLGIIVVGSPSSSGLAHICLQPLQLFALAFIASIIPLPKKVTFILLSGLLLDFIVGVALHTYWQNIEIKNINLLIKQKYEVLFLNQLL